MRHISEVIASAFPWKRCSKCGKGKPLNQFYRQAKSKDGRRPDCKECQYKPAKQVSSQERFWSKVVKTTSGCWEWQGSTNTNNGYGRFWDNGHHTTAHHFAWEQYNGKPPEGKCICHHCDNPKCVNPDHLFTGTLRENSIDAVRKNRHVNKLTTEQVTEIRKLIEGGQVTRKEIAKMFGVSGSNISAIKKGRSWGWLE